jgi:demethylmenaquinone methyltransferase/2-methoxy-6-polyprenyl-1,4-benzoquinol methylase
MAETTGASSPKSRAVREMFGSIAGRYDFLNHFLSLNTDRSWRRKCVRLAAARASRPVLRILDVGCGTADLSLEFAELGPVVGCDFCHPMLRIGREKAGRSGVKNPVALVEGDALTLPFRDAEFDVVASAFVLRNLADLDGGLREMRRVVRPAGVVAVLDFSLPRVPVLGPVYRFYFSRVLPRLGRLISGVEGPYRYLPDSVRTFPEPDRLAEMMSAAGFPRVEHCPLTGGIAFVLLGIA